MAALTRASAVFAPPAAVPVAGLLLAALLGAGVVASPMATAAGLGAVVGLGVLLVVTRSRGVWRWLCLVLLLGYIVLTRGFAYISLPAGGVPLFVGELVLLVCLAAIPHGRTLGGFLALPSTRWLLAWLVLGVAWLVASLGRYQVMAVRDAALFYYAAYAYVGYAFVARRSDASALLRLLAVAFVAHAIYAITYKMVPFDVEGLSPYAPGSDFPLLTYRPDANAAHLAGGVVLAMLLGEHFRWPAVVRWSLALVQFALFVTQSVRAAYVGFLLLVVLLVWLGRVREVARMGLVLSAFVVALAIAALVGGDQLERLGISPVRLWEEVASIADVGGTSSYAYADSEISQLNTQWRLEFWAIVWRDNTRDAATFLLGRGFGPDLTTDTLFTGDGDRPNRYPHNVAVSLFARMGVVGILLWGAFHLSAWLGILRGIRASRLRGDRWMEDALVFLVGYVATVLGTALFGVILESPFGGVLYYFLIGATLRLAQQATGSLATTRVGGDA
jgi:hypothetical protein